MRFTKKIVSAALAAAVAGTALSGLPLSERGVLEKLGFVQTVHAGAAESFYSSEFIKRLLELHQYLQMGDPVDVQEVRDLRDEIGTLSFEANGDLIAPIWNKLSGKIDPAIQQPLFDFMVAAGSLQFDPSFDNLEAIRKNPAYSGALQAVAALARQNHLTVDDAMQFMNALEQKTTSLVSEKSNTELLLLMASESEQTKLLGDALETVLADTSTYKVSAVLAKLDITKKDMVDTVTNFRQQLKKEVPAIRSMMIAYMRSGTKETVEISNKGRKHTYKLSIFGREVPKELLVWSKPAGSKDVKVAQSGVVTIPGSVVSAKATLRASLLGKVLFEKEVTLGKEEPEVPEDDLLAAYHKEMDSIISQWAEASSEQKQELLGKAVVLLQTTWKLENTFDVTPYITVDQGFIIFKPTVEAMQNYLTRREAVWKVLGESFSKLETGSSIDQYIVNTPYFNFSEYLSGLTSTAAAQEGSEPDETTDSANSAVDEAVAEAATDAATEAVTGAVLEDTLETELSIVIPAQPAAVIEDQASISFEDLGSVYAWAGKEIEAIAAKGIIEGVENSRFDPNKMVTRAEFAKMLFRSLDLKNASSASTFKDVPITQWYAPYVGAAVQNGLVQGRSGNRFEPEATITHAEMATMIARAAKLSKGLEEPSDVKAALADLEDAGNLHPSLKTGVAFAAANSLLPLEKGSFPVNANTTRAEAAVMLYRLINL
ncbi:S-layer homology domain-containing protein [Paenibacillus algorifonticola]|uniref:S-layer homology domain-containing protein n=1 Tax=Paenibacillus algorifonticola TaxID=684063 RepID=A0A1I2GQ63_9BACL|nr:S-layer homology domain-containing protein [Paenibacillus algorifonticola]SFF19418.1 S-layer homology domain-containing protein [Paenibacillus algorifonticola]